MEKRHGRQAKEPAKLHAIDLMEKKDAEGQAVWRRVAQAVDELTKVRGNGVVH